MDRQLRVRRQVPYFVSTGLILGLTRPKGERIPKSRVWWHDIVKQTFGDNQWIENFRMRKESFMFLCNQLEPSLKLTEYKVGNKPLDIDHKVAIAVYWLASSAEYRTIGNLFGVSKSTVWNSVHDVCEAISESLTEEFVQFPSDDFCFEMMK